MKRQRNTGSVYQPGYKDRLGVKKRTSTWWFAHACRCCPSRKHREGGFETKADARAALNQRLAQIARGKTRFLADRETLEMLLQIIETDYQVNGRAALPHLRRRMKHLVRYFGAAEKVVHLTGERLMQYVQRRQEEGAKPSTINHELGALRRAFILAIRLGRLDSRPYIPRLREDNARQGFFQREEFDLVLAHLQPDLRPLFEAAYITGWRTKSELTTRQWRHVDWGPARWLCRCGVYREANACEECGKYRPGWIHLDPQETKNRHGRQFPLLPRLREVLQGQRDRTDELERATGQIIPWVFWRAGGSGVLMAGAPIRSYHRAWTEACKGAGITARVPHDLRRTAVLNLEREGIARSVAKQITGHLTDTVYNRYAIPEAGLMEAAGEKLQRRLDEQAAQPRRVVDERTRFGRARSKK